MTRVRLQTLEETGATGEVWIRDTGSATGGAYGAAGGGGAPTTAQYVTLATDATLTNERVLTAGDGITIVDGGAGAAVTVALAPTVTRAAGDTSLGLEAIAGQAGYVYVVGDADPFTYVQMLAGTGGYVELGLFPGSGIDAVIKNQNIVGPAMDLDIQGQLGAAVVINKQQRNVDFYVSSDTAQFLIHADATLDQVGIGTGTPNEKLTVEGRLSLRETTAPTATADYGKIYVKATDGQPYFMDDAGVETAMLGGGGGGTFGQTTATFSGGADSVTVTVVDAGVGAGSNIVPTIAMGTRDADEMEMAPVVVAIGTITAGVGFTLIVVSLDGDADGDYLVNYTRD